MKKTFIPEYKFLKMKMKYNKVTKNQSKYAINRFEL